MCRQPVKIHGAGRTDAGVHARGQRAHVDIPIAISPDGIMRGLNTLLPDDIRISAAEIVADDFHSRYHVKEKTYVYRVWNDEVADVFAASTHALVKTPLDEARMHQAATILVGEHDFRAFTITTPAAKTTVRTIYDLAVRRDGKRIEITVRGKGFLRYMVRRIVGLLIEVGADRVSVARTTSFFEPTFDEIRWTAPPEGLTLEHVEY